MQKPIHQWSAAETAARVCTREASATAVAEAICERVIRLEPTLNAFADFDPALPVEAAFALDRRLAQGEHLPLAGVVFSVKDNLWLEGRRATFGSRLFADFVAPRDSWAVARLRSLGAVPLGVTNCSEFASRGVTCSPLHGATRNPWNVALSPGGSSGGAVAAVAAGLGPLALATDAGGSTRRPAALTGLVGMKPTLGRVPDPWGFDDPNGMFSSIGQIGRNVEDVAWMLDVLTAWEPADFRSEPGFAMSDLRGSLSEPVDGLRLAWSPGLGLGLPVDDGVMAVLEGAIDQLAGHGWRISRADPHWPKGVRPHALSGLQQANLAHRFGAQWRERPDLFDAEIGRQIEVGLGVSGTELCGQLQMREQLHGRLAEFFESFDALLCPVSPVEAWAYDRDGPDEIAGQPADPRGHSAFTPLFNYTGVPAISLPCGVGPRGLSVGLQIVGPRFADARVLNLAWHAECAFGPQPASPMSLQ